MRGVAFVTPHGPATGSGRVEIGVAPEGRSELVRLSQAIKGATLLSRRGICVDCISFYCRWQLLSVLSALTPGPEVAGDMAAAVVSMAAVAVVSMAAVAEAFTAATAVEASAVVTVAEAFAVATAVEAFAAVTVEAASAVVTEEAASAVVTQEAASAVVTEVIEAVTVAGDMDAVTATEAAGGMGLASG